MKQEVEKNNSCHHAPRLLRSCVKVAMTVVAIAVMFSAFTAPLNLRANEVSVAERWNQLVDLYIKNEFSNGNLKLRKFERVGPIAIVIDCGSLEQSVCQHAKQVLNESFEPSANVRLIPSKLGEITFVFDNSAHLEAMLPIAMKENAVGVSDTSDRQCAMFYKFADSTIQRGKIFASTDQPPNRLYACLVFQIGRLLGPGFSLTDRFSDAWDGILSLSSDDKLKQIGHIYGMLEYIHMCPELVPGMSEDQVHRALLNPTGCMSKLERIN
jgi:hypothetical protein